MCWTTLRHTIKKARKYHKCELCSGSIIRGEKYDCATIVGEGTICDFKAHIDCTALVSAMNMDEYHEGISGDNFKECVTDAPYENHDICNLCKHFGEPQEDPNYFCEAREVSCGHGCLPAVKKYYLKSRETKQS